MDPSNNFHSPFPIYESMVKSKWHFYERRQMTSANTFLTLCSFTSHSFHYFLLGLR